MAVQAVENTGLLISDFRNRMSNAFRNGGEAEPSPPFPVLLSTGNTLEDLHLQYAMNTGSGQVQLVGGSAVPLSTSGTLYHRRKTAKALETFHQGIPSNVSTGLRLAYGEEDERTTSNSVLLDEGLIAEIERQRNELNQEVASQEEQMLQIIKDLTQRHVSTLLRTVEEAFARKMKEKVTEIDNLNKKNKELLDTIKQIAIEVQSWHNRARYHEAMANALRTNLQIAMAQTKEQSKEGCGDSEVDDAASSHRGEDHPSLNNSSNIATILKENTELKAQRSCRICRSKDVCILVWPCRHLCLCKDCETVLDLCPVCNCFKSASVQVYMS